MEKPNFFNRTNFAFPESFWIPFIRKDGHRLATYRHCAASPRALVFFFHGWLAYSGDFAETAERLAKEGFECFAIDYVGHGRSQGLHGFTGDFMTDMVNDGVDYIHKVRAIYGHSLPVFIMGLSIGGAVCVNISILIPDLKGMVLLAPALGIAPDFEPALRRIVRVINWFSPFISLKSDDANRGSRNPFYFDSYASDSLFYKGKVRAGTGVALLDGLQATNQRLPIVTTDFIAVQGGHDLVTDAEAVKILVSQAKSKQKDLWFYEMMYHVVTWEPEYREILERLVDWLNHKLAE